MQPIAHIQNDFDTKFGIPRQSGLVESSISTIVFEPEFRSPEALRGITEFSHLWLIWEFSEVKKTYDSGVAHWSPTVRPPRLGGNTRVGVFATRSPFRPNPIGLSCVRLAEVKYHPTFGQTLLIQGADLMNGTPIYDIKPYLPYVDAHPDAVGGFAEEKKWYHLKINCPDELLARLPEESRAALPELLAQDPRPSYQKDPERVYGFSYAGHEIQFQVRDGLLTVLHIS